MSIAALIRSMADAGAPAEAIALAVEAIEAAQGTVIRQREVARDRKRRQRSHGRDDSVTVTGQSRDTDETVTPSAPSLSPPPQTPPPHTHPRGDIYNPRAKAGPKVLAESFATFWAVYPKRKAKDAAERAFSKAMARIDDADPLAVILAGIERAMPGWDDPQFIPHPATWLNAGSWNDDPPAPRTLTVRPANARTDAKLAARHENYAASWSGSEQAAGILAARRNL